MNRYIYSLLTILISSYAMAVPSLNNGGFEAAPAPPSISGWDWGSSAVTTCEVVSNVHHSGRQCLKLTNKTEMSPNVYGRLSQQIDVIPSTEYELSFWVSGKEVGNGNHFTDWGTYMVGIPEGNYNWRRISVKFRTKQSQTNVTIGLNLVNSTESLFVDNIELRPEGTPLVAKQMAASISVPTVFYTSGKPLTGVVIYKSLTDAARCNISLSLADCAGKVISNQKSELSKSGNLPISLTIPNSANSKLKLISTLSDIKGKKLASTTTDITVINASTLRTNLSQLSRDASAFQKLLNKAKAKGIRCDYPTVTATMLAQFIPYASQDIQADELTRAHESIQDMQSALKRAKSELQAALAKPNTAPICVRYKSSAINIDNGSFIATKTDSKGNSSNGPVFFTGYGHFAQLSKDLDKFPSYGINIIQVEIGPMVVFPKENVVSYDDLNGIKALLDRAGAKNIAVNLLISPHYFPQWALDKWPHLKLGGGGFLGYTPDEPEAEQLLSKFLHVLIPEIANKPALHSICLSNEPVLNNVMKAANTLPLWHRYLTAKYANVSSYNSVYHTDYAAIDDIPLPSLDDRLSAGYTEFCLFNSDRFAAWHQFLADEIHSIAPQIPVHAKLMNWMYGQRDTAPWGCDPELFSRFSNINGNDCQFWPGADDQWICQWMQMPLSYDLQRSMKNMPVYNSENHISPDRSTYYISPNHYRSALWQGAVHGQGATTIWVWEHSLDKKSDFYGNIMDRPGCVDAVGRTSLDLMRCANQVTALQQAPSHVAIVYSVASLIGNSKSLPTLEAAYQALLFSGQRVSFISDRQLSEGLGKQFKLIILPNATRIPEAAMTALSKMDNTKILVIGDAPSYDQLGNPLADARAAASWQQIGNGYTSRELHQLFQPVLKQLQILPALYPVDAKTNQPVWGVEWLTAQYKGKEYINMVNWTNKPISLSIRRNNGSMVKTNVIAPLNTSTSILLPELPVLAEITK